MSASLSFSLPATKRNEIFSWVASSTRPLKDGWLLEWAILLSRRCQRHTETGTLLQLQLQQHMGQKEIWKGVAGRHTVDTFNDYCRPLKITSKSFAHKAASGIHARQRRIQKERRVEASWDEAKLFTESFCNCNCWSFRNSRGIFLSLAQCLAMKSQKFKFNSRQLRISSICLHYPKAFSPWWFWTLTESLLRKISLEASWTLQTTNT